MPTKELRTEQEVRDFVRGCTFLAQAEGKPARRAGAAARNAGHGKRIRWIDVKEVADDVWVTSPPVWEASPLLPKRNAGCLKHWDFVNEK